MYVVLCAYSDHENGTCYPSYNTIAAKAGCSRTVAVQAVKHLTELGFIQKQVRCTNGGHSSNLYKICEFPSAEQRWENDDTTMQGGVPATPPSTEGTPPSACHAPPSASGEPKPDSLNQNQPNQNYTFEKKSFWKDKIEYDTLVKEMPDKLPFLEALPVVLCGMAEEPYTARICADDVRAISKIRESPLLCHIATKLPFYFRKLVRDQLSARCGPKQGQNGP